MATVATLGGVPTTNETSVGWELSQGVEPHQRTFTFSNDNADRVVELARGLRPLTLEVKVDGRATLTVKGLYVVARAPTRAPYLAAVVVSDGRFLLTREHVAAAYNTRRDTGDKYLVADENRLAVIPPQPDIFYAKFSLQRTPGVNGAAETLTPWTARTMLEDVLTRVTRSMRGFSLSGFDAASALPVEGLTLDDAGPEALARALSYIPSLRVFMDYEGVLQLTSQASGGELAQVAANPPVVGPDVLAHVDLADVRPSAVEVYFTVEQEVRFDWVQGVALGTTAYDPRVIRNVLPIPDPSLVIGGRTVYQGTWVPIDQTLLDAWNADAHSTFSVSSGSVVMTLVPISFDLIHRTFFSPGGYTAYDEALFAGDPEPVWRRRFAALQQHYRQTYQVDHRWMDRLRALLPFRAGVLDFVNGTRAPAAVYQNYTAIPNLRRLYRNSNDPTRRVGVTSTNFPVADYAYDKLPDLQACRPVPTASLQILDQDQGIVRVQIQPDAWGDMVQMIPSLCESKFGKDKPLPTHDPRDQGIQTAGGFGLGDMRLSQDHAASTVFTVVPASPNDLGQFHKIVVKPDEAREALPPSAATRLGECRGPVWRLRVGPGIATARFVWIDSYRQKIEESIFAGVDRDDFLLMNGAQIKGLAKAVAASLYSGLVDRPEGNHVTALDPDRLPVGRVQRVVHDLSPSGAALTLLALPAERQQIDAFAMLPESVRRQILGLVRPR